MELVKMGDLEGKRITRVAKEKLLWELKTAVLTELINRKYGEIPFEVCENQVGNEYWLTVGLKIGEGPLVREWNRMGPFTVRVDKVHVKKRQEGKYYQGEIAVVVTDGNTKERKTYYMQTCDRLVFENLGFRVKDNK